MVDWYLDNFGKAASSLNGTDKPDKHSKEQATTCPDRPPHRLVEFGLDVEMDFSIFSFDGLILNL